MTMPPSTWIEEAQRILLTYAVPIGGRAVGAIVLWVIGRRAIRGVERVADRGLEQRKIDSTLARYVRSMIGVTLTVLLVLAILSIFGVETASFAGILAAAGVAIGMAWSGLLSNFAAGVFLMVLRPFKVGDVISAAGTIGQVKEIGLFCTTLDNGDNVRNFVGNAKVFGDTIQNYTANPCRRIDLRAQLAHSVDPREAKARLLARVAAIPHVLKDPAPSVEVLELNPTGSVLAVRPFATHEFYWDVYFATNEAIRDELAKAGYPVPEQHHLVRKAS
jgi:small conductance mechanosensitive channel